MIRPVAELVQFFSTNLLEGGSGAPLLMRRSCPGSAAP